MRRSSSKVNLDQRKNNQWYGVDVLESGDVKYMCVKCDNITLIYEGETTS